jgi:ribosomal protein S18 acetylase RimI-like enzyme
VGPDEFLTVLEGAAKGHFPPSDGALEVVRTLRGTAGAVVGLTGHHVVVAAVDPADVKAVLSHRDLNGPLSPEFLTWLGRRTQSTPENVDVLLAAEGISEEVPLRLVDAESLLSHPRVRRSARLRSDLRVYATQDHTGVLILGHGLCGRWEAAVEVDAAHRNRGLGRRLAAAAARLVPSPHPVFMQTAPGNAAAVRAFLAAGFHPIGSEVTFVPLQRSDSH